MTHGDMKFILLMSIQILQKLYTNFKMGTKTSCKYSKLKLSTLFFIFTFLTLFVLTTILQPKSQMEHIHTLQTIDYPKIPKWYNMVLKGIKRRKMNIALVNMEEGDIGQNFDPLSGLANITRINFDPIDDGKKWTDFFPEWIDENEKWAPPTCPKIPMPEFSIYDKIDVVVARVPCGIRDVYRLQVNLVVANLLVRSGWVNDVVNRTVYAVFIGDCEPMWEVFRCDDMLSHEDDHRIYKPDLRRLEEKVFMPVGSCQLASPYAHPGIKVRLNSANSIRETSLQKPKEAYVTILHSSETYVCGAIALAQSLIQTNTTKDLILLADNTLSSKSIQGLRDSGWIVKRTERIRSPHAKKDAYNEWNYSKLRIWELTDYKKIIFIDSDLIILKNIDKYFDYPQLSAVGNDLVLFNSGMMLVEPSKCTFETLMAKIYKVDSYNGGDQGFLNEMFTWWHRWPTRLNRLKVFNRQTRKKHDDIPDNAYAIHYLGLKPWMCYMDYDCNWDKLDHQHFASDKAHRRWWQIYKAMPKILQPYCGLSKGMDSRIQKWRGIAKAANLSDEHWKIKVKDPRRHHL